MEPVSVQMCADVNQTVSIRFRSSEDRPLYSILSLSYTLLPLQFCKCNDIIIVKTISCVY